MAYTIEKNYYSQTYHCWLSYESGNFDDKEFSTHEEAYKYAIDNLYRIEENEAFAVYENDEFAGLISHCLFS